MPRRRRSEKGLIFCETCEEMRPDVEFLDIEYQVGGGGDFGGERDSNPVACKRCRTIGPPPLDPLSALSAVEIKALEALAAGHNVTAAAKISGMHARTLQSKLSGERENGRSLRIAWQKLLHRSGINLDVLAEKTAKLLDAKERKWNPKDECFNEFDDARTQLATVRFATTQLGADPPKEKPQQAGNQVAVFINTNLGEDADGKATDADYIVKAKAGPVPEADDV